MANTEQLALLRRDVPEWNTWRRLNPDISPDLAGATLAHANLVTANLAHANLASTHLAGANLANANLAFANLTDANLVQANLAFANLASTHLAGAYLTDADLARANLTDANLTDADLTDANLAHANLTGANLTGATCYETIFADLDLSRTNVASCTHQGPSVIDVRTLMRSRDLPLSFLRGCGLPDTLIGYLPSLTEASPIQFYSVFISYATANQDFADRLHADLQAKGVRCWFARHHMEPGKKIHEQIDAAIRMYDKLLLILSRESMTSTWVKTEIAKARKKERERARTVLFPIRLVSFDDVKTWELFDADLGDDSAKAIREYYVPDFSRWKTDHDAYTRELEKLVEALASADKAKP